MTVPPASMAAKNAVAVVVGSTSIADAQDTTGTEVSHEAELCIKKLESGGEPADCQEAPGRFLAARDEVIWGAVSFAVMAALLIKFAVAAMRRAVATRTERIRRDVSAAGAPGSTPRTSSLTIAPSSPMPATTPTA